MFSPAIEKLVKLFSKFPTVGPRTAARFAFYLIEKPESETAELLQAIQNLKSKIKICSMCQKSFESPSLPSSSLSDELCSICSNPARDKTILCVVEKEIDLEAIEKTNKFKGLYFILGGTLGLRNDKQKKLLEEKVDKLCTCIKCQIIKEVILALNPTPEGKTTGLFIKRKLEPIGVKITQLGIGLPLGGEMEYADEDTLTSALDNRR